MRIHRGHESGGRADTSGFVRLAHRQERQAERKAKREALRNERRTERGSAREERRAEREAAREKCRPERESGRKPKILAPSKPIPVEADGGIGDGATPIPFPPEATTLAIGEEDGGGADEPPILTTLAVGEEDGGGSLPPDVTTRALGEEDGGSSPPDVTTLAIGEEDGGIDPRPGPIGPPDATTLAIGEEDGGIPFDPPLPFPKPGPIDGPKPWPMPIPAPQPLPVPFPPPSGSPDPVEPIPGRPQPPEAVGSYRLGENKLSANFLNFDGNGGAQIIGPRVTQLNFATNRVGEDGSIFGENGSGYVNGIPIMGNAGFKLSIAPNDAGYLLQVKVNGDKVAIQTTANGIVPRNGDPVGLS